MTKAKLLWLLGPVATLSACGSVGELTPPEGRALPPAPYGTSERPTAPDLIEPGVQTRPGRSDELLKRSERREKDPFDLPPGSDPMAADDGGDNGDGDDAAPSTAPAEPE